MKINIENCLQDLRQIVNNLAESSCNLSTDAQKISAQYRLRQNDEESKNASDLYAVSTHTEALAYAAARMPATLGAVATALLQATEAFPIEPKSILDVGAGPGTASWAACALLPSVQNVTMLEREFTMQNLGRILIEQHPHAPEPLKNASLLCTDIRKMPSLQADLVIASYSISELAKADRLKICEKLFLSANQMLLLIEPGTPKSYKELLYVREHLLSKGAHLVAPCPHEGSCQLPEDDWCHFSCRIQRDRLQKQMKGGKVPYEDEKFFYMAFIHEKANNEKSARILRKPIIKPGKIQLKLCTTTGIQNTMIGHSNKNAFRNARKADIGDLFPL